MLWILAFRLIAWIIGRSSYHIGASGLVYVLVSFIFFKSVTKYFRHVALSLAVVFLYGSTIWYIFPVKEGISWEGHLSGFVTGLVFALVYKTKIPKEPKYNWEREDYDPSKDPFMRHFDEEGNFIEHPETTVSEDVTITYDYKKSK